MEIKNENTQRSKIFEEVLKYLNSRKQEEFIPGKTWVRYAGRVFDNSEYLNLIDAALDGWITSGRFTDEFEYKFSKYLGVYSSILVNSGSSANLVALSTLTSSSIGKEKISPGDEVITVASGFPTTVNPIVQNGLVPVFVDVKDNTYNIDPALIEDAISERTRAIMLAHALGNPFDIGTVTRLAEKYNLYIVEDNCDALGSEYNGRKTGTFGSLSTVSFYPAHHITMGEGGAVNTNDANLERIARSFRDWGRDCYCETGASDTCGMRFKQKFGELPLGYDHKYVYSHIGYNLKATDLQAAIGVAQLEKLDTFVKRRKENFRYLYNFMKEYEDVLVLPESTQGADPAWFAFPVTVRKQAGFTRNEIVNFLEERKIMTRTLFAGNITRHPAYIGVKMRVANKLVVTDEIMNGSFFIGVYPGLTDVMLNYVTETLESFLRKHR